METLLKARAMAMHVDPPHHVELSEHARNFQGQTNQSRTSRGRGYHGRILKLPRGREPAALGEVLIGALTGGTWPQTSMSE